MFAESLLSPEQVFPITNDALLWISVQELTESLVVSAVSQNIQGSPTLALINRLLDVLFFEEQHEVILRQSENVFIVQSFKLFVMSK